MNEIVRLVSKLDIKGPNLIKGIQLDGFRKLGYANKYASLYYEEGIDEIFIQDSVASLYRRECLQEILKNISGNVFVPITVAGGIRELSDIEILLKSGADKIAINTGAVNRPKLLKEASNNFGSQNIVSSIEVFRNDNNKYEVWTYYGREKTELNLIDWIQEVQDLGVGEIILTAVRNDGLGVGFDEELLDLVSEKCKVPLLICGGGSNIENSINALRKGADALVYASLFHYYYVEKEFNKLNNDEYYDFFDKKKIDFGNLDFIQDGYGGNKDLFLTPSSVSQMKKLLKINGFNVREFDSGE